MNNRTRGNFVFQHVVLTGYLNILLQNFWRIFFFFGVLPDMNSSKPGLSKKKKNLIVLISSKYDIISNPGLQIWNTKGFL